MSLSTVAPLATVYRTIGLTLAVIVVLVVTAYVLVNILFRARPEVGSELEVAANRKPYYDDEVLEGPRLDRVLTWGLLTLLVSAVGLPLYWVMEPARQVNAADGFGNRFISRGEGLFSETSAEHPAGLGCARCHGGVGGGSVEFNLVAPDGSVEVVDWRAPALNTVLLRYSRDEVRFILTYGRPGTPMPAWGVDGGGALNDQQVQNLIDYLETQQLSPEDAQAAVQAQLDAYMATGQFESEGEALFNMGILGEGAGEGVEPNFAGGAYGCARCHTDGWSYAESYEDVPEDTRGCGGALGPNLCNGATGRQFPDQADMVEFVTDGSEEGVGYGTGGQGSGKMPGFGLRPEEEPLFWINNGAVREPGPGMLTLEMIEAIVEYEREL